LIWLFVDFENVQTLRATSLNLISETLHATSVQKYIVHCNLFP